MPNKKYKKCRMCGGYKRVEAPGIQRSGGVFFNSQDGGYEPPTHGYSLRNQKKLKTANATPVGPYDEDSSYDNVTLRRNNNRAERADDSLLDMRGPKKPKTANATPVVPEYNDGSSYDNATPAVPEYNDGSSYDNVTPMDESEDNVTPMDESEDDVVSREIVPIPNSFNAMLIVKRGDTEWESFQEAAKIQGKLCKMKMYTNVQQCLKNNFMPNCRNPTPDDTLEADFKCGSEASMEGIVNETYVTSQARGIKSQMLVFLVNQNEGDLCDLPEEIEYPKKNKRRIWHGGTFKNLADRKGTKSLLRICTNGVTEEEWTKLDEHNSELFHNGYNNIKEKMQIQNKVSGFIIVDIVDSTTLYIDIICGTGAFDLLNTFIKWAKRNGYSEIKLSALPYVIAYYERFGFKLDGLTTDDGAPPKAVKYNERKIWCPLFPEQDSEFSEFLKDRAMSGHSGETKCTADAARNCSNQHTKECDDFWEACHSGGYHMTLPLSQVE
jgi:hypothetical protein